MSATVPTGLLRPPADPDGAPSPGASLGRGATSVGPVPTGVTVTGGAGGIAASTEELAAIAAALAAAAQSVQRADVDRRRLVQRLGPEAAGALHPLALAGGLPALERRVGSLSTCVRDAAAVYAGAETDASVELRRLATVAGFLLGSAGPLVWKVVGGVALVETMTLALLRLLRGAPNAPGEVLELLGSPAVAGRSDALGALGRLFAGDGPLPRTPAPDRVTSEALIDFVAAFLLAAQPGWQAYEGRPVPGAARLLLDATCPHIATTSLNVRPVGTRTDRPPRDEADLLALVDEAYPQAEGEAGEVLVQRLDHADGSRSWVVAIPGTQSWTLGGSNPFDALSDLQTIAGEKDDATATVARAMELAGIAPGEPVVLAGHSLGGIVAMGIAGSDAGARYDIVGVVSAGSPVAGRTLPPTTAGLHLEHVQDVVPGTAGLPNPDAANQTTVVRDLRARIPADEVIGTLDAHSLDAYRETAAMLPADDLSVQGFRAATAPALGDDVVHTVTLRYQGTRMPGGRVTASCAPPG